MTGTRPDESPYTLPVKFSPGRIGVVTVTYNSGVVIPDFLKSLDAQTYKDFVVFAVDNASKDDSLTLLRTWSYHDLRIIANSGNMGVATGNNQGIQAALEEGCEYVLLLNNDVVFGVDLFQQLVDGIDLYGCDMTTPKTYFHDPDNVLWCAGGCFQPWFFNRIHHYGEGLPDNGQYDLSKPVTYVPTCCVLIRRDVFGRIGIMDERYFVYSDDADFMLRAQRAGLVLYYLAQTKLWHKVSSLSGALSDFSLFYSSRGRALFVRKHAGLAKSLVWNAFYILFCIFRAAVGRDTWHRAAVRIRGTREGGQIGMRSR